MRIGWVVQARCAFTPDLDDHCCLAVCGRCLETADYGWNWLQGMTPVPVALLVPSVAVTVTATSVCHSVAPPSVQVSSKSTAKVPPAVDVGFRP
jgi:hypothetical protein